MKQPERNFLIKKEKELLISQHKCEKEKKYADRIKAIIFLDEGWSYDQIAKALLIDHNSIRRFYEMYITKGIDYLLTMNYSGKETFLTKIQLKDLEKHLNEKIYLSAAEICDYVLKKFNVKYTTKGMTKLLHRLEFTYKKPKVIPGKSDSKKQKVFLEKYKELKAQSTKNDIILFMDGVHPTHNIQAAYGWIKKGQKKEILSNTGRKRININAVLNIDTHKVIMKTADTIDALSTLELFKKIEETYKSKKKIKIICDNAKYYRSKIVFQYLKKSKIELVFLPPYSPNLNLIERLWRFMRKKITYNKYYETFDVFKDTIMNFFQNLSNYEDELKSLLTENFEIINSQIQVP